jgi:hypothetical protein
MRAILAPTTLAIVLIASPALAASGKVTFLEGSATRTAAGGAPVALIDGAAVLEGDALETSAGGRLEVTLEDGSIVRVDEKSRLLVDSVVRIGDQSWKVKLTLALGQIWSKVTRKVGEGAGYEVHTERAVAGVRGTEFLVEASGDHNVEVDEGVVDVGVRGADGLVTEHHLVNLGERLAIDASGRTAGPIKGRAERAFRHWLKERLEKTRKGPKERRESLKERRYDRAEQRRDNRPR